MECELLTEIVYVHHSIRAGALSPVAGFRILSILRGGREALDGRVDLAKRFCHVDVVGSDVKSLMTAGKGCYDGV